MEKSVRLGHQTFLMHLRQSHGHQWHWQCTLHAVIIKTLGGFQGLDKGYGIHVQFKEKKKSLDVPESLLLLEALQQYCCAGGLLMDNLSAHLSYLLVRKHYVYSPLSVLLTQIWFKHTQISNSVVLFGINIVGCSNHSISWFIVLNLSFSKFEFKR